VLEALARANFDRHVSGIDRRVAARRGWTIVEDTFPVFDIVFNHATSKPIRLRFHCEDWDEVPPLIEVLEADCRPIENMPADPRSIFNNGPNPNTGRKFICMRGSRCYHQLHREDSWDNHRGKPEVSLGELANQLWRVWRGIVG
jgi:hypothetical protein